MALRAVNVEYEGEVYSLRTWCAMNRVGYDRALDRWHAGVRDPIELLYGSKEPPPLRRITDDDIAFLRRTRYAREGQEDEWEIACDLIDQPHIRIPEIRKLVLG